MSEGDTPGSRRYNLPRRYPVVSPAAGAADDPAVDGPPAGVTRENPVLAPRFPPPAPPPPPGGPGGSRPPPPRRRRSPAVLVLAAVAVVAVIAIVVGLIIGLTSSTHGRPSAESVTATARASATPAASASSSSGATPTSTMSTGAVSTGAVSTGAVSTGAGSTGAGSSSAARRSAQLCTQLGGVAQLRALVVAPTLGTAMPAEFVTPHIGRQLTVCQARFRPSADHQADAPAYIAVYAGLPLVEYTGQLGASHWRLVPSRQPPLYANPGVASVTVTMQGSELILILDPAP